MMLEGLKDIQLEELLENLEKELRKIKHTAKKHWKIRGHRDEVQMELKKRYEEKLES